MTYDIAVKIIEYQKNTDHVTIGVRSYIHKDFETSLYHFNLALELNPNDPNALIGMVYSLIELGNSSQARQMLGGIRTTYPDKSLVLMLIGDTYLNEGNYNDAIDNYILSINSSTEKGFTKSYSFVVLTPVGYDLVLIDRICRIEASGLYDKEGVTIKKEGDWINCVINSDNLALPINYSYQTNTSRIKISDQGLIFNK